MTTAGDLRLAAALLREEARASRQAAADLRARGTASADALAAHHEARARLYERAAEAAERVA